MLEIIEMQVAVPPPLCDSNPTAERLRFFGFASSALNECYLVLSKFKSANIPPEGSAVRHAGARMYAIAERLALLEQAGEESTTRRSSSGIAACEKMREQLSPVMGSAGFNAMLVRALALAKKTSPGMSGFEIGMNGDLTQLEPTELKAPSPAPSGAGVVVLAELLGLLVAFIGEPLIVGVIQEVWPKFTLRGLDKLREDK